MTKAAGTLLRLLADGGVHSGQAIAEALGITRAAVWKQVESLRALGLTVEAVPGRGYRLDPPGPALDATAIERALGRSRRLTISVEDRIDSTSSAMLRQLPGSPIHGQVLLAEFQDAGRGRRGRQWQSAYGQGLCLSLGWRVEGGMAELAGLSLALGVAACRALNDCDIDGCMLKWPNDLLLDGRKLGGVLVEMRGEWHGPVQIVAGIGINVHGGGDDLERADLSGRSLDRNVVAARLLERWCQVLDAVGRTGISDWLRAFADLDALADQPVRVEIEGHWQHGVARGVDPDGSLRVEFDDGIRTVAGSEVSIRHADAPV